jgi:hypothetical protein
VCTLYVSPAYTPTLPSLGGALVISMVTSSGNRSPPRSLMPSLHGIELVLLGTRSTCLSRSSAASPVLMLSILLNRTTWESHTEQAQTSTMRPWWRLHPSVHQTHRAWTVARHGFAGTSGSTRLAKASRRWTYGTPLLVVNVLWGMTT